jgi:hypothetical protein
MTYHPFNNLKQGSVVQVNLKQNAKVLIMDNINLQNFNNGSRYQYLGGNYSNGIVQVQIPSSGTWNLVVQALGNSVVYYDYNVIQ